VKLARKRNDPASWPGHIRAYGATDPDVVSLSAYQRAELLIDPAVPLAPIPLVTPLKQSVSTQTFA
jgi:hypothetical protein